MSTITKQWLQQTIAEMEEHRDLFPCDLDDNHGKVLAAFRIALASLGAEAVAEVCEGFTLRYIGHGPAPKSGVHIGDRLYTAPPAPASVPDYPETLPCPVMLEPGLRFGKGVNTRTMLVALQRRAQYHAELEAMTPEQRAEHDAGMKEFAAMLQGADGHSLVILDGVCPCCGRKPLKHSKCSVPGCGRKHVAHGLCQRHYDMRRRDDPEQVEKFREANRRFAAKKRAQKAAAPQQEVKP